MVLIEWARRRRGLIVGQGMAKKVTSIADLKGCRVTPRQEGSGAQGLFLHLLRRAGLGSDDLDLTDAARSESDAALMVLEGRADVAFGLAALAAQYRLAFVPVIEERFDLLVDRRAWFEPPMQIFLDYCRSDKLRARARDLAGYDLAGFGRVLFNGR